MEKKEILFLSLFLIILFLGQLYIADRVIFGDDYIFATFAEKNQFFYTENAHPPLPVWSDILLTEIFPLTNRTIRLTSIIFATLTVGLVYFITKKVTIITPTQTAILATIITGVSAWHIRASQMNSGSDGGMFTFFFYLTVYFFLCWKENKRRKWLVAIGIGLGLTMLAKETGFLLIPILGVGYCLEMGTLWKEDRKEFWKQARVAGMIVGSVALLIWSIFPILDLVYNNGQNMHAIAARISTIAEEEQSILTYSTAFVFLYHFFKLLLWTGPLLVFFPILWLLEKEEKEGEKEASLRKIKNIFVIIILIEWIFYLFLIPQYLDKTRYLMVTIPALSIVSAEYMTKKIKENKEENQRAKKGLLFVGIVAIIFFGAFLYLNTNKEVVSYESLKNPIVQLKNGNIFFSVPVFAETDNAGFLLNFSIFFITYGIATFCFFLFFFFGKKRNKIRWTAFLIFIAVSSAYNFIVAEEYGLHWASPDYSNAIMKLIEYGEEEQLKEPLYLLKNYEFQYYWNREYAHFITTYGISEREEKKIHQFEEDLKNNGGTIIFTDMPPIDRDGTLWKTINSCRKDLTIEDKGVEIGYIFTC